MSEAPFKPGQVVVVISGGPVMTVSECAEDQFGTMTAWCTWFEKNKKMSDTFPVTVLKLYEGD